MSLLAVQDLAVHFGGVKAVDGVTFDVREGEIFTIIGPNGAGKSTLFNLISRIYEPDRGRVTFGEHDVLALRPHRLAGLGIARTFQNLELFDHASVLENLMLGRHVHRRTGLLRHLLFTPAVRSDEIEHRRAVEEVIDLLDLEAHRHARVGALPYGVRKVVELGRALCSGPRIVLLDEPSSGLNVEETEDMSYWISDIRDLLGITVVMVEHDMTLVHGVSDRVLALDAGRVIALGTPDEVRSDPEVIRAYLGETR